MDYYDRKNNESAGATRISWYMFIGIAIALLLAGILSGCKTKKTIESTDIRDSIKTEYLEKIVKDTVTVTVEIPAESKERETTDTTSFLETSIAKSRASLIWKDGTPWLQHSLENKPQKIEKPVEVSATEKVKTVLRTRYVTKSKIQKEELPWWKKGLMWAGAIETLLVCLVILAAVLKRKLL